MSLPHGGSPAESQPTRKKGTKRRREPVEEEDDLLVDIMPELKAGRFSNDDGPDPLLPVPPGIAGGRAAVQSASYAVEVLSDTYGTRTSCFGTVVKDDKLTFWHYDSCGIVYTKLKLSFLSDFDAAAAAIVAIANCTPERFGGMPSSVMSPPNDALTSFPPKNLQGYTFHAHSPEPDRATQYHITLQDSVNTAYCLTGRRSFVYTALIDPVPPGYAVPDVIVKFSYQVSTRRPENEIVNRARSRGVDHIPDIHAWEDLWLLKDSTREIARRANADLDKLKIEHPKIEEGQYEDRVLRAIVYTQYHPIRDLFKTYGELIPIMIDQMLDCKLELSPLPHVHSRSFLVRFA